MFVLGVILISLELVIGSNIYWRDYKGTIPSDAFVDRDTGLAIVRVYSKKYASNHPTVLGRSTGSDVKYEAEKITENMKVLCTDDPEKFSWEWVNGDIVRTPDAQLSAHRFTVVKARELQPTTHHGLVEGGYDKYGYVFIAKAFIKGRWYLGELDSNYCYFYNVDDCSGHYVTYNYWCQMSDCQVLKYQ